MGVGVGVGVLVGERVDSVRVRVEGGRVEVRVEERVVVRRCTVGLGLWDVLVEVLGIVWSMLVIRVFVVRGVGTS